MSPQDFRRLCLSLREAVEGSHVGHADFRVGKKIFATLGYPDDHWAMVKLTPEQQDDMIAAHPQLFEPVKGAWGRQGCTLVNLARAEETPVLQALEQAWRLRAPKALLK